MRSHDQHSRILHELCSMVFSVLGSPISPPHCVSSPSIPLSIPTRSGRQPAGVTPSGLASLLLGVSLTLMLCGSLTFIIGFILMPWVLGLVTVLHMIGFVSSLSGLARLILAPGASGPSKRGRSYQVDVQPGPKARHKTVKRTIVGDKKKLLIAVAG